MTKSFFLFFFLMFGFFLNAQTLEVLQPKDGSVFNNDTVSFITLNNDSIYLEIDNNNSFNSPVEYITNTQYVEVVMGLSQKYYWRMKSSKNSVWTRFGIFSTIDLINMNSLVFWLDSEQNVISNNSNRINLWQDKIGNISFIQNDENFKPSIVDNDLNDYSYIHFGKQNNSKTFLNTSTPFQFVDSNMTVIINYKLETTNLVSFVLSQSTDVGFYVGATFQNRFLGVYDGSSSFWKTQTAKNEWGVATLKNDNLFFNGDVLSPYTQLNASKIGMFNFDNIGSSHFTSNVHFHGDVAEILIFNQSLNDSVRNLVEDYLKFKYTPIPYFGDDTVVCNSEYVLKIPFDHGYSQITWSNGQTNVDSIIATNSGTYWVTVKSFGIEHRDTISIALRDKPSLNFQNDTISCVNNGLFLTYSNLGAFEYTWNTGLIDDTLFNLSSGDYYISQNDTASGCIINSDPVNVVVDSFSIQSTLGLDRIFCLNSNLELQSSTINNEPYLYEWSTGDTASFINLNIASDTTIFIEVTDAFNCKVNDTIEAHVTNLISPNIDFIADTICFGVGSAFESVSSTNGIDVIINYFWNFPDGSIASGINTIYLHDEDVQYNVTHTVQTDSNCENSITKPVYIHKLPMVDFNLEVVCAQEDRLFYDGSYTFFPDAITDYEWFIDNDSAGGIQNSNLNFNTEGLSEVKLKVKTNLGCIDSVIKPIEVFPALNADFSFSNNCIGDSISFKDETQSLSVVNWNWAFNGFNSSSIQNPKFVYNALGTQTISLEIENALGCKSVVSKSIEISPQPIASFGFDKACISDTTLFFDKSTVLLDSVVSNVWEIDSNSFLGDSINYSFEDEADYNVYFSITTEKGCFDDTLGVITINPLPNPSFGFTPDYGTAPLEVSFLNETLDADSYNWSFGDAQNSIDVNPKHTYSENGIYNVTLKAINEFNCENIKTEQIAIIPTDLDLELKKLNLDLSQNGNNTIVNANVQLSNVGTRNIENADLILRLDNGDVLAQKWAGNLEIGKIIDYSFDSYFIISDPLNSKYVCVEAVSVNDNTELNLSNNKTCTIIDGVIQFSKPYPNPVNNFVNLDVITKEKGDCRITVSNMLGEIMKTQSSVNLQKGFNKLQIETANYQSGKYFIKIVYLQEEYLYSFVVI